jgi:hypothetical protein
MRAVRRLFAISTVVSRLLCAAAVIAWVKSEHEQDDSCRFFVCSARYTLHSTRGRLSLMGAPRADDDDPIGLDGRLPDYFEEASREEASTRELASRIRNEDVQWVRVPLGGPSIEDAYCKEPPRFFSLSRYSGRGPG